MVFSSKLVGLSLLLATSSWLTSAEDCEKHNKEISAKAKILLSDIENKVCKKCKVHLKDVESKPDAKAYVEKEILVTYKGFAGALPVNNAQYKDIVNTIMEKCIKEYSDKELCKEMKPNEDEIKACIIQNVMFKISIPVMKAYVDKYCAKMNEFFGKNLARYRAEIAKWPSNHKGICK